MRYEEDLTQPAIAARLGIPEGTVKVQLHRARLKLRRAYVAVVRDPSGIPLYTRGERGARNFGPLDKDAAAAPRRLLST